MEEHEQRERHHRALHAGPAAAELQAALPVSAVQDRARHRERYVYL